MVAAVAVLAVYAVVAFMVEVVIGAVQDVALDSDVVTVVVILKVVGVRVPYCPRSCHRCSCCQRGDSCIFVSPL